MRLFEFASAAALIATGIGPAVAQAPAPAALGVHLNDTSTPGKIIVDKVFPGLTAESMGLRQGDELLEINGTKPADADAVVALVQTLKAGDPVSVTIRRGDQHLGLKANAVARPDGMATGRLQRGGE